MSSCVDDSEMRYAKHFSSLVAKQIEAYKVDPKGEDDRVPKLEFFVEPVIRQLHVEMINLAALCMEKKAFSKTGPVGADGSGEWVEAAGSSSGMIKGVSQKKFQQAHFPDELKRLVSSFLGPVETPHYFPCRSVISSYTGKRRDVFLHKAVSYVLRRVEAFAENPDYCFPQSGQIAWGNVPPGNLSADSVAREGVLSRLRGMGYEVESAGGNRINHFRVSWQ